MENNLKYIAAQFQGYEIHFSEDQPRFELKNPFSEDHIEVAYVPEDEITPYIVCFSFQHRHVEDETEATSYIYDIVNGNVVAIEFFMKEKRRFGGDMAVRDVKDFSYASLAQHFGNFGMGEIKDLADSFKVRGWKPENNFDAVLVTDRCGKTVVKKKD